MLKANTTFGSSYSPGSSLTFQAFHIAPCKTTLLVVAGVEASMKTIKELKKCLHYSLLVAAGA